MAENERFDPLPEIWVNSPPSKTEFLKERYKEEPGFDPLADDSEAEVILSATSTGIPPEKHRRRPSGRKYYEPVREWKLGR